MPSSIPEQAGKRLDEIELTGDRLTLRRWRADDAEAVAAIMQDRSMRQYLAIPDPYTPADAHDYVTGAMDEGRRDGTSLGSAMIERCTGRIVGSAILRLTGDPEIGFWTAPSARGKGFAADATRMLVDWGFRTRGLHRIRLACDVTNLASARTAMSAGFHFEGISRDGTSAAGGPGVRSRRADLARFARLANDPGLPLARAYPPLPAGRVGDGTLTLRVTDVGDATGSFEAAADPDTRRWGFHGDGPDLQEVRRRVTHAGLEWLTGPSAHLTIVDDATRRFAGEMQLRRSGPPQVASIGYTVHPAFRGRGYTARALRLLATWAFGVGFVRLELGAKRDNIASRRAAVSAGFTEEATLRSRLRGPDGTFADEVVYALIAPG